MAEDPWAPPAVADAPIPTRSPLGPIAIRDEALPAFPILAFRRLRRAPLLAVIGGAYLLWALRIGGAIEVPIPVGPAIFQVVSLSWFLWPLELAWACWFAWGLARPPLGAGTSPRAAHFSAVAVWDLLLLLPPSAAMFFLAARTEPTVPMVAVPVFVVIQGVAMIGRPIAALEGVGPARVLLWTGRIIAKHLPAWIVLVVAFGATSFLAGLATGVLSVAALLSVPRVMVEVVCVAGVVESWLMLSGRVPHPDPRSS